jgi:predicted transcriptional regulator
MGYKNRIDVIKSVLNTANGNGVNQSEILSKANISHGIFKEYLSLLLESGLIEIIRHTGSYRTTEKGIQFIDICNKMKNLILLNNKGFKMSSVF